MDFFCDCLRLGFIFGRVIGWNEVGGRLKMISETECKVISSLNFAARLIDTPSIHLDNITHITFLSPQVIAMGKVKSQKPLPLTDMSIRHLMLDRYW